jgi:hypothetical protein
VGIIRVPGAGVAVITSLWLLLLLVRLFPLLFGLNLHRLLLPLPIIVGVVVDPWAKMVSTLLQVFLQKTFLQSFSQLCFSLRLCVCISIFFFCVCVTHADTSVA